MTERKLSPIEVEVTDDDVMGALNDLREQMGNEEIKREMELRRHYEKPSAKRRRKQREAKQRREREKRRKEKRKKRRREGHR
jgi:small subunit ribosomal protein S21